MNIVLFIIWIILCVVAIVWSILPGLPWPQLAYLAIVMAQFFMNQPFSRWFIVIRWIVMVDLIVIDYYLPILWTKKFWWSKWWNRWCIIWMIAWLFIWPLWVIIWPFVWALIWEYMHNHNIEKSIKSALWSFIWFMWWVVLKFVISIVLLVYFCIWCYNVLV